jgi:ribosomal protein L11 methyltransferase
VDAATAFGSGHHESTFGCLTALSALQSTHTFKNALDMGCGSGILALGIASLWDCPVVAIDNDSEAVRVTLENAKLNCKENIHAFTNNGFEGGVGTFDLIAANILAGPLIQMAPDLENALNQNGFVVLAGLLATQADDVIKAYGDVGITLVEKIQVGVWNTLVLEKK